MTGAADGVEEARLGPGAVLRVPDFRWGFVDPSRSWHPGVCTAVQVERLRATMVKGTDRRNVPTRYQRHYYVIEPSNRNGLTKDTAFELAPRRLKLRPLALSAPEHTLGALDDDDLAGLQRAMRRAIGR